METIVNTALRSKLGPCLRCWYGWHDTNPACPVNQFDNCSELSGNHGWNPLLQRRWLVELGELVHLGSIRDRPRRSMDPFWEVDGRAEPGTRALGRSAQPQPLWFRCVRHPLGMPKADEVWHVSIPAPVRSTSSRMLSASAPRICSGEGEPQPFSLLQARFTFVSSWAYCSQKPALPVMHQMCKKSSRSSCYHRQPHLQQQRLVLWLLV